MKTLTLENTQQVIGGVTFCEWVAFAIMGPAAFSGMMAEG